MQGPPDEAANRLTKELTDKLQSLPASRTKGAATLQEALSQVALTRSEFGQSTDQLIAQQKGRLDGVAENDRRREEELKKKQQSEQEDLADRKKTERIKLVTELEDASKELDHDHRRRRSEMMEEQHTTKRQSESASGEELKSFKEGQFRDADAFKRKMATRRVEEDKGKNQNNKREHESMQEERGRDFKQMEVDQEQQKQNHIQESEEETAKMNTDFDNESKRLDEEHAEKVAGIEAAQKAEKEGFIEGQATRLQTTISEHKEELKQRDHQEQQQIRLLNIKRDDELRQLEDKKTEERKQLALRHKDDLKKFAVEAETRRTELAAKQEDDRKAMFAARRASNLAGEKMKEVPDDKKVSPQKERDALEAIIVEDRKKVLVKQEAEGEKLLSDQAAGGGEVRQKQDDRLQSLKQSMQEAREKFISEHEEHLKSIDGEKDELLLKFDQKLERDAVELHASIEVLQANLVTRRGEELEMLAVKREDLRKKLLVRQADAKNQLVKQYEEKRQQLDSRHDERRKRFAQSLEEELSVFSSEQEISRNVVVTKQKGEERALEESQFEERNQFDEIITDERTNLDSNQKEAIGNIDASHDQQQIDLDQQHSTERTALQSEFQKARTRLAAEQTSERDQHSSEHRTKLLTLVERAQNEFNHALLGRSCVLLTAPPAAGKTCLVSQLMMQALNDKTPPFIPLAIRVQSLQRRLLLDRGEITSVKARQQKELHQLESTHAEENHHVPFDQVEAVKLRHKEEREKLETEHARDLAAAYQRSTFANAWNWVDAYLREEHGVDDRVYLMFRQALMSRRVLLLLDGLDEGGAARDEIERHIVEVLAPQGHAILVTSRPHGLSEEPFVTHFERLALKPLLDTQQQQLIERRIPEKARAEELLNYVRERVPLDIETGTRMTGNPLMLSMIISLFESAGGMAMPDSLCGLYAKASAVMLERDIGDPEAEVPKTVAASAVPQLTALLEAIFFRAHSAQRRMIEEQDVEAAALEIGAAEELSSIDWPHYKGRVRVGQVVKLLRGIYSGKNGVLTADARGTLINGKEPRNPFKVTFPDKSNSGWVRDSDFLSSGLERTPYEARYGNEARRKAMRGAVEKLSDELQEAIKAVRGSVARDQLPLLTLLQSEPLLMQSSHLSFQEFYCARAIHKGMVLPGEPPWRWSAWWANCLRLGIELGQGFGEGLMRAAGAKGQLNLFGQIGGHRPTALAAVAELMLGLHTIDLSQNGITRSEVHAIAKATKESRTLTELSLAKNPIGDEGAAAFSAVLGECKLTNLNFFCTGMKEEGARAFTAALVGAPSLTRLNLQYNALRADSKKALELANKSRTKPLFLVI